MMIRSCAARLRKTACLLALALCAGATLAPCAGAVPTGDVLALSGRCLTEGRDAFATVAFTTRFMELKKGDVLEYDVMIPKADPQFQGGVVVEGPGEAGTLLCDSYRGLSGAQAVGQWTHRVAPLDALAGQSVSRWELRMESKSMGEHAIYVDNVIVRHASGEKVSLYESGPPLVNEMAKSEMFSDQYYLTGLALDQVGKARANMALVAYGNNISKGGKMDFYCPIKLTSFPEVIPAGSQLEYDIFIPKGIKQPRIAVDLTGNENSITLKGTAPGYNEGLTPEALGTWFHKVTVIPPQYDARKIKEVDVTFEADLEGEYAAFFDNIRITNKGKALYDFYTDGPVTFRGFGLPFGYSNYVVMGDVPREQVPALAADPELFAHLRERIRVLRDFELLRTELEFANYAFAEAGVADKLDGIKAQAAAIQPQQLESMSTAAFQGRIQAVRAAITKATQAHEALTHKPLQRYTGHLVGHAHIDLEWVWRWQHTIDTIIPETFGSALNFMKEYPDFTFSQSSPALYFEAEKHYPKLFAGIKRYVKEGRWEYLGGRWCEGDTNMLTNEEQVHQFIVGQQYYKERFGKIATVGWEPDTFGHTWMMPQLLRKAGLDCYYFCRAGKSAPIFWWEAPDGSRVLGLCDNSGYSGPIDTSTLHNEMPWFRKESKGSCETPMVYGVGNHGGGPTRESVETAHEIQKSKALPKLKFTTAREMFDALKKTSDLAKLPVVCDELNPTFPGCYTSACDMKRWNRKMGERLPALEALRVAATQHAGMAYPQGALTDLWRDLSFVHHHDTMCGTSIHDSYIDTFALLKGDWSRCDGLEKEAMSALASRIEPVRHAGTLKNVLLFNASGTERKSLVKLEAGEVGVKPGTKLLLRDSLGKSYPAQWVDERTTVSVVKPRLISNVTLPACGWQMLSLEPSNCEKCLKSQASLSAKDEGGKVVLTAKKMVVTVDKATGAITSILDRSANKELLTPGKGARLVDIHEKHNDMPAWDLGKFLSTDELPRPTAVRITMAGPVKAAVEVEYAWRSSKIYHEIALVGEGEQVDVTTNFDWHELGTPDKGYRLVKFAVPFAVQANEATYEIPFAWIKRPASMGEVPAMRWAAKSDGQWTMALLNDSRHGHDLAGGELRLSLIRCPAWPDILPNQGWQTASYQIAAKPGQIDPVWLTRRAEALNAYTAAQVYGAPAEDASVKDALPASHSLLSVTTPGAILSAYKQAEDGKGFVARVYDVTGQVAPAALTFDFAVGSAQSVDLIERKAAQEPKPGRNGEQVTRQVGAHEIVSLRVQPKKPWQIW